MDAGVPIPSATHDLNLTASNATSLAGDSVNFSASVPGGAAHYDWGWGDGTESNTTTNRTSHTYSNPGIYLVYVAASNSTNATGNGSGIWHDNLDSLLRFQVQNSFAADAGGNLVQLGGNVVANSTNQSGAEAIVSPGGFLQVSNWVMEQPSNPNWAAGPPSYNLSIPPGSANLSTPIVSTSTLNAVTVSISPNATTGIYTLNYTVPSYDNLTRPEGSVTSNFTFTVVVANAGTSAPPAVPQSPHPGVLVVREDLNQTGVEANPNQFWPAVTLDPALIQSPNNVAESVEQEVYQTLISHNGSDVGMVPQDFVPNLATCVPGSTQCLTLYGSNLTSPTATTFVVNPNATFYNATTGAHARVEPNDIAFSLVRECLNGAAEYCGSVLPTAYGGVEHQANQSWDGGLHYFDNNTPPNLLEGILVNDTTYCTPKMMDGIHGAGCVTLNTSVNLIDQATGDYPGLLESVAETTASVYSCDWMAEIGFGLPGWTNGTSCFRAPPGDPGNPNAVPGNLAWDSYLRNLYNLTNHNFSSLLTGPSSRHAVGSGPYFLQAMTEGTCFGACVGSQNYTLEANPYWGGTTCSYGSRLGCLPVSTLNASSPAYIPTVHVYLSNSPSSEISGVENGTSDLTMLPEADASFTSSALLAGLGGVVQEPTSALSFYSYNLNYSRVEAANLTGKVPTLPAGALQDYDLRMFLTAAYPHETAQNTSCLQDGLQFCFQYGGILPSYDTGLTPTNLSWPVADPSANASEADSAAWWWVQTSHDNLVGKECTAVTPCTFPIAVPAGAPALVVGTQEWVEEIENLSGGALEPWIAQMGTGPTATGGGYLNLTNDDSRELDRLPFPIAFSLEDPADMLTSSYLTYHVDWPVYAGWSFGTIVANDSKPCGGSLANPQVSQTCQGTALSDICCAWGGLTAFNANVEDHIAANLSLYLPSGQTTLVALYAPWIDPTTLDLNPLLAAEGLVGQPFYELQYRSTIPLGYPLTGGTVSGLEPSHLPEEARGRPSVLPTEITLGTTIPLLVSVAGGSGRYSYSWSGLPNGTGCVSLDRPSLRCTPSQAGDYSIEVRLTDSKGASSNAPPIRLTVAGPMSVASFEATPATVDVGAPSVLNVTVHGGAAPFSFAYSGLPPGCASESASSLRCVPASPGNYQVVVTAGDALGQSSRAETNLSVVPAPVLESVSLTPSGPSLAEGATLTLTASPVCSPSCPGNITYAWSSSGATYGHLNASSGPTASFTAGYTVASVNLTVQASWDNRTVNSSITVRILGSPSSSRSPGLAGDEEYAVLVALALAVVVGGLFLWKRRGARKVASEPGPSTKDPGVGTPRSETTEPEETASKAQGPTAIGGETSPGPPTETPTLEKTSGDASD